MVCLGLREQMLKKSVSNNIVEKIIKAIDIPMILVRKADKIKSLAKRLI